MSKNKRFWDRIARKYASDPIPDEAVYAHKLEKTQSYFTDETRVLEYGCGTGATAIAHAPYVSEVLATDLSDEMITICWERAREAKINNVHFEAVDVFEIEATENAFDVVLGLNVLHLVEDRRSIIAKSYDLTEPGGVFITSTACLGDSMWFLSLIRPFVCFFGIWPYFEIFKEARLIEEIKEAGFAVEYRYRPKEATAVFLVARRGE